MQNRIIGLDYIPANQLLANPNNPRPHPAKQREALRGSLETLGWYDAVIMNRQTGYLIDGHARVEEQLTVDEDATLPVLVVDMSPEEEAQALASHDWISQMATYDAQVLDDLLREFNSDDQRVTEMLAEMADDLGVIDAVAPNTDPPEPKLDEAQALQQKWETERGQLWRIGNHRLMCGDSAEINDVKQLIGDDTIDVVFSDPPYGMNLNTDFSKMKSSIFKGKTGGNYHKKIIGDDAVFLPDDYPFLLDAPEVFLWGADYYAENLPNRISGSWLVWDKRLSEEADKMWGSGFELCWSKKPHKRDLIRVKWAGIFGMETQDTRKRVHPTQKPVELVNWILERYSSKNNIVYDAFGGSGSTMVACEQLDRQCRMIEIDPEYTAVILQRMADMGLEPDLVSTNTTI